MLWPQSAYKIAHPSEITPWLVQTIDEAQRNWISAGQEDNGDRFGRCLCGKCRWDVGRPNHRHVAVHQVSRKGG